MATCLLSVWLWPLPALAADAVSRIEISDPDTYWQRNGYVEMHPAMRVSIVARSNNRTRVYLRLTGKLSAAKTADGTLTLIYPPGSSADRVSDTRLGDGTYTIADVRGTRWDETGKEYFHVYRPAGPGANADLVGYEWPRGDADAHRQATTKLLEFIAVTPAPPWGQRAGWRTQRRFRQLNQCAGCHIADKAAASSTFSRLPPWATDRAGLYVPLAVLSDQAILSTSRSFHDPNATDPMVEARCDKEPARRRGAPGAFWFQCRGPGVPIGHRDMNPNIRKNDPYGQAICTSRRYLYDHMDDKGKELFASYFADCRLKAINGT